MAWHPVNRHETINDISFSLERGEMLGIAGLVGAGREIFSACLVRGPDVGRKIYIDVKQVDIHV